LRAFFEHLFASPSKTVYLCTCEREITKAMPLHPEVMPQRAEVMPLQTEALALKIPPQRELFNNNTNKLTN
jgi:hypothetical protein